MIEINKSVRIHEHEVNICPIRAQGPGGQNVNKVATAVHLFFDSRCSSLPESYKRKLLQCKDGRITKDGVIVIKAQACRSLEGNKQDAVSKLRELVQKVVKTAKVRKATRATTSSQEKRLKSKSTRSAVKKMRSKGVE